MKLKLIILLTLLLSTKAYPLIIDNVSFNLLSEDDYLLENRLINTKYELGFFVGAGYFDFPIYDQYTEEFVDTGFSMLNFNGNFSIRIFNFIYDTVEISFSPSMDGTSTITTDFLGADRELSYSMDGFSLSISDLIGAKIIKILYSGENSKYVTLFGGLGPSFGIYYSEFKRAYEDSKQNILENNIYTSKAFLNLGITSELGTSISIIDSPLSIAIKLRYTRIIGTYFGSDRSFLLGLKEQAQRFYFEAGITYRIW